MLSLSEMLAAAKPEDESRPLHEAQIERLREAARRYREKVLFRVGDLVTPRADSPIRYAGEPHLVIDVRPMADYDFSGAESGLARYGMRHNLRVLVLMDDHIAPFWVEAAQFEPYVGEKADAGTDR